MGVLVIYQGDEMSLSFADSHRDGIKGLHMDFIETFWINNASKPDSLALHELDKKVLVSEGVTSVARGDTVDINTVA